MAKPLSDRLMSALLALAALAVTLAGPPGPGRDRAGPGSARAAEGAGAAAERPAALDVYRGLGSWVDIYDASALADPEGTVAAMGARGVRTLYIETSNFRRGRPFVHREELERFVDAAHARGMAVVAWYLPGLAQPDLDLRRSLLAIGFRTPSGQRFDSFALDIESPEVANPFTRTARLRDLSEAIREAVGEDYPLGAIVPSPRGMKKHPDYWPSFPWADLHRLYDVFVPMTYFTWRTSGMDGARSYSTSNVRIIRREVEDRNVPIHVIGGISEESTTAEARGFVRAVRELGVLGGSYYDFPGTTPGQWAELARIPVNPVPISAG
jgi:hypothetical protein